LGVPPAGLRGLQNSSSNDLAVHFQLANILKCLAGPIVCLVHTIMSAGLTDKFRIYVGHDVSS
jgi:hypothetical protein